MDQQNNIIDLKQKAIDDKKREKFFLTAEPLFMRYGYKKTTIEDICKASGTSKRTFYSLFKDKTELSVRMVVYLAESMLVDFGENIDPNLSSTEKMVSYLDEYIRFYSTHPVSHQLFNDPDFMSAMGDIMHEIHLSPLVMKMNDLLQEGVDRGEFRKFKPESVTWIIFSLLDSVFLMLPDMFKQENILEELDLAREVKAFVLNGLGVRYENE
jgi:AcrR family transcriptional regulator